MPDFAELENYVNALKEVDRLFYALSDENKELLAKHFDFKKLDHFMTKCWVYGDNIADMLENPDNFEDLTDIF